MPAKERGPSLLAAEQQQAHALSTAGTPLPILNLDQPTRDAGWAEPALVVSASETAPAETDQHASLPVLRPSVQTFEPIQPMPLPDLSAALSALPHRAAAKGWPVFIGIRAIISKRHLTLVRVP